VVYFGPLEPVPNVPGSEPLFLPTEEKGVLAILDPEMLRNRWLAVSATALTACFDRCSAGCAPTARLEISA
jgi:hypothetical protein